jgi:hypothetical protein
VGVLFGASLCLPQLSDSWNAVLFHGTDLPCHAVMIAYLSSPSSVIACWRRYLPWLLLMHMSMPPYITQ